MTTLRALALGLDRVVGRIEAGVIIVLARIMHHAACFCMSVEQMRASDPSGWIGVRPLAVQRVWY